MLKQIRRIRRRLNKRRSACRRGLNAKLLALGSSFVNGLTDVLKYAQLDDFHQVVDRRTHFVERFVWFIIILFSAYGIYITCSYQWNRYVANPTVISLERDYRNWNGTLPAVTLCYSVKVDPEQADFYIQKKWNQTTDDEDYQYLMEFVETIANLTLDNFHMLYEYEDDERLANIDLRDLVETVYPTYKHIVRTFDSSAIFDHRTVITERGMCHTINAPITKLLSKEGRHIIGLEPILSCHFARSQCFMKVDFYDSSATVELHSPDEVPVIDSNVLSLFKTDEITATYKVVETLSSESLRKLSVKQRKCVFRSEIFDKIPQYSGRLCEMNCRALNAMELCHCKPFYYPFFDGPECTIAGYLCLHRYSWPAWTLRMCKCGNSCVFYKYLEHSVRRRYWAIGDLPFMQKSSFRWEILPAKMRNRRDVLFSFEDFVVSFGGAVTLFLGINFWQFFKIGYKILEKILTIVSCSRNKK